MVEYYFPSYATFFDAVRNAHRLWSSTWTRCPAGAVYAILVPSTRTKRLGVGPRPDRGIPRCSGSGAPMGTTGGYDCVSASTSDRYRSFLQSDYHPARHRDRATAQCCRRRDVTCRSLDFRAAGRLDHRQTTCIVQRIAKTGNASCPSAHLSFPYFSLPDPIRMGSYPFCQRTGRPQLRKTVGRNRIPCCTDADGDRWIHYFLFRTDSTAVHIHRPRIAFFHMACLDGNPSGFL
ncbi:hypothetical protein D1872_218560 [compost metagenome]